MNNAFVPGQVIAGKFEVISLLGSGGMGSVYRVEQIFLKKEFALKTMDNRTGSELTIKRFELEAKAAFSLNHPNLVKVHDYGILDNENPYLVMDYIDGVTFADYLKKQGPIPIKYVAPLFAQACFGLMAAHEKGVVHRDIKPANLMLLNNVDISTEGSVKIVDFGIAKLVDRQDGEIQALTRTGEIFGSPLYMSPEQCSSGTVDNRSDIYSLGCVLFEMLTGTPPHMGQSALKTMLLHQGGETPTLQEASLGQIFPEEIELIVAKMLRKYPEQRYQNIGLVAHDLTIFGADNKEKSHAKPLIATQKEKVTPDKVVSMTQLKLAVLIGLTAAFAAVLAGSAVYFISSQQSKLAVNKEIPPPPPPTKEISPVGLSNELYFSTPQETKNARDALKANVKLLEQLPQIQEQDVGVGKEMFRQYKFPDVSLGDIFIDEPGYELQKFKDAEKTVSLPANQHFGLTMRGPAALAMIMVPSTFKKLPQRAFHRLIFGIPTDGKTTRAMPEDLSPESMQGSVATALENLDGWTNLEALLVKSCFLNHDALNAFTNIKKLRSLSLERCELDSKFLATLPFLDNLEECDIDDNQFDSNPIIKRLCTSSALGHLSVDSAISVENLHNLQRCRKLKRLQIRGSKIDDRAIAEICEMKTITELELFRMRLNTEQIQQLIKCSWLKKIKLSRIVYGDEVERVAALDPRIALL